MEPDVPTYSHSVLEEHLQGIDKQKEIELYYELLSSGHSVGEILDSLGHIQCKSEHGRATTVEHPSSGFDRAAPDVTSGAVLMSAAQANTRRASDLTSPLDAESCRTEESRTRGSTTLDELGPDPDIVSSPAVHPSNGSEIELISSSQERSQPGKFSNSTKRIAFGALYTVAIASVSIGSFSVVSGSRIADSVVTPIQPGIFSAIERAAIPGSSAGRSEMVVEIPQSNKQVVNAGTSRAPEPSRAVEPVSAISGPPQRDITGRPAAASASTAYIEQAAEPSRRAHASVINRRGAVDLETGGSKGASMLITKEIAGQQIVRAFYTALEKGKGEAASLLVIPEKRKTGPLSAGELSRFYGRMELPLRLIEVNRAGDNLYNVAYSYKVRNGRLCNGRSLVTTITLQNQVLIEKIHSPSRC